MKRLLRSRLFFFVIGFLLGISAGFSYFVRHRSLIDTIDFPFATLHSIFNQGKDSVFHMAPLKDFAFDQEIKIIDQGDEVSLELSIEGLNPNSFSVSVENQELTIEGQIEQKEGNMTFNSSFYKRFPAPDGVVVENFTTEFKDKKLYIRFPKAKGE